MIKDIVGNVIRTYKEFVRKNNLEDNLDMIEEVKENANKTLNYVEGKLGKREYRIFLQEIIRRLNVSNCLSEFCLYKATEKKLEDNRIQELNKILKYQGSGIFHLEHKHN